MSETKSSTVTSATSPAAAAPSSGTKAVPASPMERRRIVPDPFTGHSPTTKVVGGTTWTPPKK